MGQKTRKARKAADRISLVPERDEELVEDILIRGSEPGQIDLIVAQTLDKIKINPSETPSPDIIRYWAGKLYNIAKKVFQNYDALQDAKTRSQPLPNYLKFSGDPYLMLFNAIISPVPKLDAMHRERFFEDCNELFKAEEEKLGTDNYQYAENFGYFFMPELARRFSHSTNPQMAKDAINYARQNLSLMGQDPANQILAACMMPNEGDVGKIVEAHGRSAPQKFIQVFQPWDMGIGCDSLCADVLFGSEDYQQVTSIKVPKSLDDFAELRLWDRYAKPWQKFFIDLERDVKSQETPYR